MVNNCPHCRSKYVALKDTEETFGKTIETYECQSCKKKGATSFWAFPHILYSARLNNLHFDF